MNSIQQLFSYKGRINRLKYFYNILAIYLTTFFIIFILMQNFGATRDSASVIIVAAINIFANLCNRIKRAHDLNKSGYFVLLYFIPLANIYAWFMLLFVEGTHGTNKYVKDPLGNMVVKNLI